MQAKVSLANWQQFCGGLVAGEQGALENGLLLLLQEWKKSPSTAFSMSNPSFPGRTKKGGRRKLFLRGPPRKKGERRGENGKGTFPPLPSLIGRKLRHNSRLKSGGRESGPTSERTLPSSSSSSSSSSSIPVVRKWGKWRGRGFADDYSNNYLMATLLGHHPANGSPKKRPTNSQCRKALSYAFFSINGPENVRKVGGFPGSFPLP